MNDKSVSERRLNLEAFDAILLDVGNVMVYDFPIELAYSYYVSRESIRRGLHIDQTVDEILQASQNPASLAQKFGSARIWQEINSVAWEQVLENWGALCIAIPGAIEALRSLSYLRLAIVANQPVQTMATLESLGIVNLFEEIIFDSLAGVSKPSTAIYRYAAHRLHTKPESLVMIGDRLDNDIFPAKAVGMAAVWIHQFPMDETLPLPLISNRWKRHYFRAKSAAYCRYPKGLQGCSTESCPDYVVERLTDLLD
jgi:HAD superfamily hydrolase (TIGR01549 family)